MLPLVVALAAVSIVLTIIFVSEFVPVRDRNVSRKLAELEDIVTKRSSDQRRKRQAKRERLEVWLQAFGERVASGRKDFLKVRQRLMTAGYRRPGAVSTYYALRFVSVGVFGALLVVAIPVLELPTDKLALWIAACAIFGWLLPGAYLSRKIRLRQKDIQKALPDTLDLMVICVEAGLGLNQAMQRVSEEIENISEIMAEELHIVSVEIRAGTPRDQAMRNLGDRTDVKDLRSLVAMLIQTDRFGTSIAQALRVHSDALRVKRRQRAEEAAAKTTIKLVVPLVLFIFPSMFVVILGPAILNILNELSGL
jgi:tight adherence protein C